VSSTDQARPDLVGGGPYDYWSAEKQPSRGQHETVARLCAELFGVDYKTRVEASVFIARLRAAAEDKAAGEPAPTVKEAW
jgi:hypothetical protein